MSGANAPAWVSHFNPLPPCGGRLICPCCEDIASDFNPLPPCGGRLRPHVITSPARLYFNPLPPCGGRPSVLMLSPPPLNFNPLPPCGGRHRCLEVTYNATTFQSTPSVWRETWDFTFAQYREIISIHSLRVEGDYRQSTCQHALDDFNPLPPCGGRQYQAGAMGLNLQFQSTPSVWRETKRGDNVTRYCDISIHSLRVEGDHSTVRLSLTATDFNPLPPCGGRQRGADLQQLFAISIHSLRVEGDFCPDQLRIALQISIHSLRVEGDP